jgi:hypothetical protein
MAKHGNQVQIVYHGEMAFITLPFSQVIREDFKASFGNEASWMDKAKQWVIHNPNKKLLDAWQLHAETLIADAVKAAETNPPEGDFITLHGENYRIQGYHRMLPNVMRLIGGRFIGKDRAEGGKPYWEVSVLDRAALDQQMPTLTRLLAVNEAVKTA